MEEKQCAFTTVLGVKTSEKSGQYIVSLSDGADLTVNSSQIADFGFYEGREFSEDEYSEMISSLNLSKAKSRAVKILGNRNLSAAQMKKKLVSKGEADEVAQAATDWLLELKMIDDEQYAFSIVNHYLAKGYGPLRIKDEMYKRGIPRDMFCEILSELDDFDVSEAAESYLKKKLKGSFESGDLKNAANALIRRGFSYEQADSAIKKYIENA